MNLRTLFKAFSIAAIVTLIVPNLLVGASVLSAGPTGSHFVHLPASAGVQLASLGLTPALSLDYGAFRWLELNNADYAALAASGIPFEDAPDAGQVRVLDYAFDPIADGEPSLPAALRANENVAGFRLVQIVGPTKDEWLARLSETGMTVLQYYPFETYLVWATPSQAQTASALGFVRWAGDFHPAYKINADLKGLAGQIKNVDVMFYNDGNVAATLDTLASLGASIVQYFPAQPDKAFYEAVVQLNAASIEDVARLNTVLWMGYSYPTPVMEDEMSSQIIAGNYTGTPSVPFTGYNTWLNGLGLDGDNVIWAIIDSGVDYDHPDLGSHIVGGYDFPGACSYPGEPGSDCSSAFGGGHGTHVSGIVGGDATAGYTDANGYLYGLGVAPAVHFFAMNSGSGTSWPPSGGWQEHSKRAVLGGAIGGNNSWTTGEGTNHGYQASERTHDLMVLDGNFDTAAAAEPFIEVFSAGNSGPSAHTLTAPKEAKNLIVVASSINYRVGNIDNISSFSSRGPAVDGRWVPTITAPGEQIASTRNDEGGDCSTSISGTNNMYAYCSGTSMASPHVSGAVVLLTQWWRGFNSGATPSPEMAKALLVNSAVDMSTHDIPNANEGWGRVNLGNLFDPDADRIYRDQETVFHNSGETWTLTVGVADPGQPLKVTVAWADAAGAVGANPALVNNLNLTVVNGANTYKGNVFSGGWSATGGSADTLNNLENVFIQTPGGASATITIDAINIAGDGVVYNGDTTDQDFALVCSNCIFGADFTISADPATQSICAPTEASYTITLGQVMGFNQPVALTAYGTPAGTTSAFTPNPATPPTTSDFTISDTNLGTPGSYSIDIVGVAVTQVHTATVGLELFTDLPAIPDLTYPSDEARDVPVLPTFTWLAAGQAKNYTIEIATDAGFTNIVESASGLTTNAYTPGAALAANTIYYWRVLAANTCGDGAYSIAYRFLTSAGVGQCAMGSTSVTLLSENFDAGDPGWLHGGIEDTWALNSQRRHSLPNSFKAVDKSIVSDQWLETPALILPAGQTPVTLRFWDYQKIENRTGGCYDGGIIEVTTNGGQSWTQLEGQLLTNPYDGAIASGTGNPLSGLNAWCGNTQNWFETVADLSAYAGQTVAIRYRMGTNNAIGLEGWYVDDVSVTACTPTASLGPDTDLTTLPGVPVTHTFTLENDGADDTYTLDVTTSDWPAAILGPTTITVTGGSAATIDVRVDVPGDATGSSEFTLTAQSADIPGITLTTHGVTTADPSLGVELSPAAQAHTGGPGETVNHVLTITNTAPAAQSFSLDVAGNLWATDAPLSTGMLDPQETITFTVSVTIPPDPLDAVILASDTFTLTATGSLGGSAEATGTTYAGAEPAVAVSAAQTGDALPGEVVTYTFTVTNQGNYTDTFTLAVTGVWTATLPGGLSTGPVGAGDTVIVTVVVVIPAGAADGDDDVATLTVTSSLDSGVAATTTATTTAVIAPQYRVYLPVVKR